MNGESLIDNTMVVRLITILTLVVGMIVLASWLLRRFGANAMAASRNRGKPRRLSVIEVRPIGAHHKLVLVGRDDVQHLLLLGQNRDVVVETGINPPKASEDPLERVRFRDILPENPRSEARILHPGERVDTTEDPA